MSDEEQHPAAKSINVAENQERCANPECGHFHYLHGDGTKAHSYSTKCVVKGCLCTEYSKPHVPRIPKPRLPKPLDRGEPQIFEVERARGPDTPS